MSVERGYVTVDENDQPVSAVPEGIRDLVRTGDDLSLDPETEEKLHQLWEEAANYSELKAKYKLEVVFTERRSKHAPFSGFVMAWSNGGFAHGGGDEVIYFCTSKNEKGRQCNNPLDLKWIGGQNAVCPKCRNVIEVEKLMGQIYAKLPHQHWATLITRVFRILDCDADIRLGVLRGDLRTASNAEQERDLQGDKLNKVRLDRRWVVYPLSNIIKDTSAGADLYGRIRAFLSA